MLDASACRTARTTAQPVAALSALAALRALLSDAMRGAPTGAAIASPESCGDRHATPLSPASKAAPSTRPRSDEPAGDASYSAGLVRSAGAGAADADGASDPPARPRTPASFRSWMPNPRATAMSADKIGPQHRAHKAVLCVRQSSAHQVQHNRESQGLQYAMRDRLAQLGWSQIEIIDEDLGCSAARGTARAGFRAHGRRGLPGQGRRGGSPGGLSLRAQQPRLAATR